MLIIQAISGSDQVGPLGSVAHNRQGWRFVSYVQRGNGRIAHDTAEQAVPRWVKHGYLVDAPDLQSALEWVKAYRAGAQWADAHAAAGRIRSIRSGRVY